MCAKIYARRLTVIFVKHSANANLCRATGSQADIEGTENTVHAGRFDIDSYAGDSYAGALNSLKDATGAINGGTSVYLEEAYTAVTGGLQQDLDGAARIQSTDPDMGVYESAVSGGTEGPYY